MRYGNKESKDFLKCAELLIENKINIEQLNFKNKTPLDLIQNNDIKSAIENILQKVSSIRSIILQTVSDPVDLFFLILFSSSA